MSSITTPSEWDAEEQDVALRVGGNVRNEIVRADKTQGEVAEFLGMDPTQFSRRLRGHIQFRMVELVRIARFLSVPVGKFLEGL